MKLSRLHERALYTIKNFGVTILFIFLLITKGNAQNTQGNVVSSELKNGITTTQIDNDYFVATEDAEYSFICFSGVVSKFDNGILEILQGHLKLIVPIRVLEDLESRYKYNRINLIAQLKPGMVIYGSAKQFPGKQLLEVIPPLYLSTNRLHGQIQSIDLVHSTIHILNQEVLVNSGTILRQYSQEITLDKIKVGSNAFVNVMSENGQLIADSITTNVGLPLNAVQGNIIGVQGNIATVLTPNIQVELSNTEIRALRSCPNLSTTMLVPGSTLRADGIFVKEGTLLIAKTAFADLPDEGYLTGVLSTINQETGTMTILDKQIKIVADTIVQDQDNKPIILNNINPNTRVYINVKVVDGKIVATRLTPLKRSVGLNLSTCH